MTNRNADHPAETSHTHPQPTGQPVEIHPAIITWALVIGLVVAFAVTASSFKLSFATLYDLAAMAGMRDSAWVIPVVLDGPILAAASSASPCPNTPTNAPCSAAGSSSPSSLLRAWPAWRATHITPSSPLRT